MLRARSLQMTENSDRTGLQRDDPQRNSFGRGRCIHQLIEAQVRQTPDAAAVIFEEEALSYRELNHRSNVVARRLNALGVRAETPVVVCMESSLNLAVAVLGVLKAGGALVPIDAEWPVERQQFVIRETGRSDPVGRTWLRAGE